MPLTEAGELDTAALDTAVDTARTAEETYLAGLAEAAGVGSVSGFGGTPPATSPRSPRPTSTPPSAAPSAARSRRPDP